MSETLIQISTTATTQEGVKIFTIRQLLIHLNTNHAFVNLLKILDLYLSFTFFDSPLKYPTNYL